MDIGDSMTVTKLTDFELATLLRKHNVINNYRHIGDNVVEWFNNEGKVLVKAIYDNTKCTKTIYLTLPATTG